VSELGSITINLDEIAEIARLGARRAAVFMAFGVNAAENPDIRDHQLQRLFRYRFLPDDISDDALAQHKKNFADWIVSSGLRELVESFAIFLDHAYFACLSIGRKQGDQSSRLRRYEHKGITGKLEILSLEFGVAVSHPTLCPSLNKARNCLAHRRGIVQPDDCNEPEGLVLSWRGLEVSGRFADGREKLIPFDARDPIKFQEEATITVRTVERRRAFRVGEVIAIPPHELPEICWNVLAATDEIIGAVADLARGAGILRG
jgi:hypothetical protein